MKLLKKYAYRKLQKMAANVRHSVKLPDPDAVRKVGVLWQPTEIQAFHYVQNYFTGQGVILRNLCVYTQKPLEGAGANAITPNDLNWLGFPGGGMVDDFIGIDFDLLLNISLEQNLIFDYLTALSKATFKIGWSTEKINFFDLNINISGNRNALYLAQQQIFYLRQLNEKSCI